MFKWLRRNRAKTLQEGFKNLTKILDELEVAAEYVAQVPGHKPISAEIEFYKKAIFNLASYRDEVQIAHNLQQDKEKRRRYE